VNGVKEPKENATIAYPKENATIAYPRRKLLRDLGAPESILVISTCMTL